MLNHLCAPEAIHIDSSIEMVAHIFPHSFFFVHKRIISHRIFPWNQIQIAENLCCSMFFLRKKCQTILLRINHRLFKILLPKRHTKRKENVLLQMEILVCRLCLPVLIESNKRSAHMKYMSVSIIMGEKKTATRNEIERTDVCVCAVSNGHKLNTENW